jgi:hypothetical protein
MRDSMVGDFLAGGAKAMEAAIVAVSIASGVGAVLLLWASAGGAI